jgi:hypothetical protein
MRRSRWLRRLLSVLLWLCAVTFLMSPFPLYVALMQAVAVHAGPVGAPGPMSASASQDPSWVAAKLALLVRRPTPSVAAGASGASGAAIPPPVCPDVPCTHYPPVYVLDTSVVQNTLEPAKVGVDAASQAYTDQNMSKLCGPGAAANALAFWGKGPGPGPGPGPSVASPSSSPTARPSPATFVDTANGVATAWTAEHNRAYLLYLAWQVLVPGWTHPGLMDTHTPSWGVTLYGIRDGLNWEASNHDANASANASASAWHTYFYTLVWWNQSSAQRFHQQVQDDLANAHVPVVAEVEARLLPNWAPQGKPILHFITVVGYDDTQGIYYYTDTCGKSTDCGSLADGGVHTVAQAQLWTAITAIPVNTSTAYNAGDGGYVW